MLPMTLFPLLLALYYTDREVYPASILLFSLRKEKPGTIVPTFTKGSTSYLFFGISLICAGAVEAKNSWYLIGVVLLVAWSLWRVRPKRRSPLLWFATLVLAFALAFVMQIGLVNLQRTVSKVAGEWIVEWLGGKPNAFRRRTAIGDVGLLKLSDKILFQVELDSSSNIPLLLKESCFNLYRI